MSTLDPYLAEKLAQHEKEVEAEAQQTIDPSQQSVGGMIRTWTAKPAFWVAVGTIIGTAGIAALMMRGKSDEYEDDEEDDDEDASLFEEHEDTTGLDDEDVLSAPKAPAPAPKKKRKPRAKKPKTGELDEAA